MLCDTFYHAFAKPLLLFYFFPNMIIVRFHFVGRRKNLRCAITVFVCLLFFFVFSASVKANND